jgi:hypothetical protein
MLQVEVFTRPSQLLPGSMQPDSLSLAQSSGPAQHGALGLLSLQHTLLVHATVHWSELVQREPSASLATQRPGVAELGASQYASGLHWPAERHSLGQIGANGRSEHATSWYNPQRAVVIPMHAELSETSVLRHWNALQLASLREPRHMLASVQVAAL